MIIIVIVLGLVFGSFVNALVWRLHKKRNFVSERSECTHCHHVLAWYDLLPVISWLMLRGRCRYCHKKIEDSPFVELGTGLAFGVSYAAWPLTFDGVGVVLFVLWLVSLVFMAALLVYDLKWMLLPDVLTYPLIGLGIVSAMLYQFAALHQPVERGVLALLFGLMSVAGIYGLLFLVSKGAWVGFGDVKLGIFMGLILGWEKGLLAIFLANLLAFIVVFPGLVTGKISRTARIPFGPFLIIATVLAYLYGDGLVATYFATIFPVDR